MYRQADLFPLHQRQAARSRLPTLRAARPQPRPKKHPSHRRLGTLDLRGDLPLRPPQPIQATNRLLLLHRQMPRSHPRLLARTSTLADSPRSCADPLNPPTLCVHALAGSVHSRAVRLLEPVSLGRRTAPNRILFGPHVTNLGRGRALSDRHLAYYRRRLAGGLRLLVTEEASVHASDWPYERSPLATECADGWNAIAGAAQEHGATVLAALGHAGGQGSSAYSQRALWAPSRVPEVNSREVPKWMEAEDIAAVVDGFAAAAAIAVGAGCDGVEINAGQHSLVRQFLSGLTNHRGDEWGQDRTLFARSVLEAVRAAVPDAVVGLRLSCDELAPWAGITPEQAPDVAAALAPLTDYLVVVRGAIFSVEQTRPDMHQPPMFNVDVCRAVRAAVPADVAVFLQGSVVDPVAAEQAVADGMADGVEMTRAQIADPDLVSKLAAGHADRIRPCIRCNQTCQVRDARNPIVTCVGEPSSGHEWEDPDWDEPARQQRSVLVVGGGPAGLEAARVATGRGHAVRLVERASAP